MRISHEDAKEMIRWHDKTQPQKDHLILSILVKVIVFGIVLALFLALPI